ncbi:MAG TPA: hypothetical protein VFH91_02525 [Pyrinomonadaceae bacterium]|nr:hypothetical protein [Pyrinomonadaceae bacterium]
MSIDFQEGGTTEVTQPTRDAALLQAEEIARSQMARQRKKLGTLTCEQEIGIEMLLRSTALKISE